MLLNKDSWLGATMATSIQK